MGDPLALLGVQHDTGVVVEESVIFVKGAHVLGDGLEEPAEARPRLAVERMRVCGRDHIGAGGVHLGMDRERGPVQVAVTFDDVALLAHENQVGNPDVAEVDAEGVDPEVVEALRVPRGDVTGDTFVEPEPGEEPKRCG